MSVTEQLYDPDGVTQRFALNPSVEAAVKCICALAGAALSKPPLEVSLLESSHCFCLNCFSPTLSEVKAEF